MPTLSLLSSDRGSRVFTRVKYIVYVLLAINVLLFLREELLALQHTFVDGFSAGQLIQVFSATIDTAAWVILLLLFELETWVLEDERIQGWVKWALHGTRGICYIAIVYAFTGYWAELQALYHVMNTDLTDACSLLGHDYSLLLRLDKYVALDAVNCIGIAAPIYQIEGFNVVAGADTLSAAQRLAWTDIINSGAWILVCVVLEVEVRLQLRGNLSDAIMLGNRFVKLALYGVLFAAATYWGVAGDFLDFWDAALWLFAFIFIELNVFEWQNETQQAAADTA